MKYARKVISLLLAMVMALSLTTGVWAENENGGGTGTTLAETLGISAGDAADYVNQYFEYQSFDEGNFLVIKDTDTNGGFYQRQRDKDNATTAIKACTDAIYNVLKDVEVTDGKHATTFKDRFNFFKEMLGAPLLRPEGGTGSVTNINNIVADGTYVTTNDVTNAQTYFKKHFSTYYDDAAGTLKVALGSSSIDNGVINNREAAKAAIDEFYQLVPSRQVALNQLQINVSDAFGEGDVYFWQLINRYQGMLKNNGGGNQSGGNRPATGNIKDISNLQNQDAKDYVNQYIDYNYNSQFDVTLVCFKNADIDDKTGLYADVTSCVNAINAYDAYMALSNSAKDALDELYVMDNSGNKCRFSAQMEALRQLADNGTGANNTSSSSSEFDEVNKALRNAGYTAPRLGVDFTVSFPAELVRGQDYDFTYSEDGVLTVIVLRGSEDRWLAAAENNQGSDTLMCRMTFINKGYSKYALINGNSGGSPWIPYIDGTMRLDNIRDGMVIGAGNSFAAVNYANSVLSVTPSTGFSDMRSVVALDDGNGDLTKYLLVYRVVVQESFYYEREDAIIVTPADTNRTKVTALGNEWEATQPENGVVTVMPKIGKTIDGILGNYGKNNYQTLGTVTVTAPTGYGLALDECVVKQGCGDVFSSDRTTNTDGAKVCNIAIVPVENKAGTSEVRLTWYNPTTKDIKQESLKIIVTDRNVFGGLASNNIGVTTPNTVASKPMSGTQVSYDNNGVFYTKFSGTTDQLPSFDDLQKGVLIEPSNDIVDQVTHFRSRSMSRDYPIYDAGDLEDIKQGFDVAGASDTYSIKDRTKDDARTVAYVLTEVQNVGGVTVCFTYTQDYHFQVVQWLHQEENGDFTVLGYSYLGGKNDSFVTQTETSSVSKPEDADGSAPFVVGEGMEFSCTRYPQESDKEGLHYFQFHVRGEVHHNGEMYKVYIPYAYFGMTKEEGLARAERGEKPVIYHYYGNHVLRAGSEGEFYGQYTAYGIYFEVSDFSPFVVDCSAASNSGSGSSGGGHRVTTAVKADSPATFDAGIALYGALAISSLTGMAYVGKKKF